MKVVVYSNKGFVTVSRPEQLAYSSGAPHCISQLCVCVTLISGMRRLYSTISTWRILERGYCVLYFRSGGNKNTQTGTSGFSPLQTAPTNTTIPANQPCNAVTSPVGNSCRCTPGRATFFFCAEIMACAIIDQAIIGKPQEKLHYI